MMQERTENCPRCSADDVHLHEQPAPDAWPNDPGASGSYFTVQLPIAGWIAVFVGSCVWAYAEWVLSHGDILSLHGPWTIPFVIGFIALAGIRLGVARRGRPGPEKRADVREISPWWPTIAIAAILAAFVVATGLNHHWAPQWIVLGCAGSMVIASLYNVRHIMLYARRRRTPSK